MNIIAIDTATECLGLCLQAGDRLTKLAIKVGFRHAETLVPWIAQLCTAAGLEPGNIDLVVVSIGPGSFTGLRIGIASALGIAEGASCAVTGVPTLDAMAWGFRRLPVIALPVIDARKGRLYAAFYEKGHKISQHLDISEKDLAAQIGAYAKDSPCVATGPYAEMLASGINAHCTNVSISVDPEYNTPNTHAVLELGLKIFKREGSQRGKISPIYLRKSEAERKLATKRK